MEKLSPEKVMEILKQCGTIVSLEEAILIIEFLRKLASVASKKNDQL